MFSKGDGEADQTVPAQHSILFLAGIFVRNRQQTNWTISDLVDLEFFFVQDDQMDEMALSRRDRELYLSQIKNDNPGRSVLLHRWLELRRESHRADHVSPLPGKSIDRVLRVFPYALFFFGSIGGISLSRLVMSGGHYINVFFALLVLVLLPGLLTLILGVIFPVWRFARRGRPVGKGGEWVIGTVLPRLSRLLQRSTRGQKRILMEQVWDNLQARSSLYSGVMSWFAYRSFQLFGLGFSLGVLGTLITYGLFTSLSFGWGTTIGLNETLVSNIVNLTAAPWDFLGFTHQPNPDQIRASVFPSHGNSPVMALQDEHLRNLWAKFFLWAIVVYTVLPRLLLFGFATLGSNRARRRLSFSDAQCEALLRRMQHPQVKSGTECKPVEPSDPGQIPPMSQTSLNRFRVLIPSELLKRPRSEQIEDEIQNEFKVSPLAIDQVSLEKSVDADFLATLAEESIAPSVMLILESWQPCINANLDYLRTMRRVLGKHRLIIVCLIGGEGSDRWATPNSDMDSNNWRLRLATLGDPYLLIHRWGQSNG